ncbi:SufE family protein [Halovulum dunhuangense]|uniref:SufE family protein n=1 Tax=Halovulum dunhuangense TaxID=1505036 RepID=A0A849L2U2_9RHOB|nr:SufE family protein [Halovulum dunhuangense]NNU80609.1 SufE family protein [Halovulum dunhuangense]
MAENFDDIAANFAFLDDWEDRYRYVIELGKEMPGLDESQRLPATKVEGCASQVWLVPHVEGSGPGARIRFEGDSDALIVRGLIAVLRALYNGHSATEIAGIDAQAKLAELGLDQHLSAQRSNGLRAMIGRIRAIAKQAEEAAA